MRTRPRRLGLAAIFAVPLAVAAISLVGLISALTGDGVRDALSWAALGVPLAVVARAWLKRT